MPARSTRPRPACSPIALGEATKTVPFVADARQGLPLHGPLGRRHDDRRRRGRRPRHLATRAPTPRRSAPRCRPSPATSCQVPPQVSAVKVDGERAYAPRPRRRDARARRPAAHRRAAGARRRPRPRHRRPRDDLRQGRLRPQPRARPRAARSAASATSRRSGASGPGRSRSTAAVDLADARGRGRHAGARGAPAAGRAALAGLPELACPDHAAARLLNGNAMPLPAPAGLAEGATAWASRDGVPLAVGIWRAGALHPSRVFVLDDEDRALAAPRARRRASRHRLCRAAGARGDAAGRRLRLGLRRPGRRGGRGRDRELRHRRAPRAPGARPILPIRSGPAGSRSSAATSPRSEGSACWR